MPDIKREAVALPTDISQEIIAKTQEESAVMRLSRHIALPAVLSSVITGIVRPRPGRAM